MLPNVPIARRRATTLSSGGTTLAFPGTVRSFMGTVRSFPGSGRSFLGTTRSCGGAILAVLLAAAIATTAPLGAQTPDTLRQDTVYQVESISVRAVRPSATVGGVSAVALRLDSVLFRPAPLLEDVLRELPLVQVRTNSRGEAQLALRGADERQVAILLDGVPLTLGWDHRTDLSVIPMTAAQSVRLLRGMSSVLHGPNVLGGVVEIDVSSVPVDAVEPLQASAGIDHHGGYSVSAQSAGRFQGDAGQLVLRGGVGHREREGFAAPDLAPSVYGALGGEALRVNSDIAHTDGFFTARFAPTRGGWLSATGSAFEAARGVPPELDDPRPRLWRYPAMSRFLGILAGGITAVENELGRAGITATLGVDVASTRIDDFALPTDPGDPALSPDAFYSTVAETEDAEDRSVTFRVKGRQTMGAAALSAAITFAEIARAEVITVGRAGGEPLELPGEYRQRLWSVGAEAELPFTLDLGPLTGGRISGGLAWDGGDTPETGSDLAGSGPGLMEWGGRIGASASTRGGALLVHGAVSRRGRFPSLREMYSSALGRFHPNPGLRPEILSSLETGFTSRFGRYDMQVVGFHQRLDQAIARGAPPASSAARYMRVNRDQVRSTGVELLAGYTVGRLTLETELTLQAVEVTEPGSAGVRPEYEPRLAGGLGGTMPLPAGIQLSTEIDHVGPQFCSTPAPGQEDFRTLDPSTRADLQLSRSSRLPRSVLTFRRIIFELAVDNVADSTLYDQCGLPRPGRTLRLQLQAR